MNVTFLTSFPLDVRIGSGVVRTIEGLHQALESMGEQSSIIHPEFEPSSLRKLALRRLSFNRLLTKHDFSAADVVIGSDFDGYALPDTGDYHYCALNAGLLADIMPFEQGTDLKVLNLLSRREKQNMARAERVFVPSRYARSQLVNHYQVDNRRTAIVPLGINLKSWQALLRAQKRNNSTSFRILAVAKQYRRKGIADLITAFGSLVSRCPEASLTIVGGGPELEANKNLAASLDLRSRIQFTGDVHDPARLACYYKNADTFCLPTRHETFGIVFLEAMAAGLPVVACSCTAVPEVVTPAQGFLCPPGDTGALAGCLAELFRSDSLRRQMGLSGLRRVKQYSWQHSARILRDHLKQIVLAE